MSESIKDQVLFGHPDPEANENSDALNFYETWPGLVVSCEGLMISEAEQFAFAQPDLRAVLAGLDSNRTVHFVRRDLGGNDTEEIYVDADGRHAFLYQQSTAGQWQLLDYSGEDDAGNIPHPEGYGWYSSPFYGACSNCSIQGDYYYEILQDSLVYRMKVSGGFNVDHEYSGHTAILSEHCDGSATCSKDGITVRYRFEFSEVESGLVFMKNHAVKIHYAWNDSLGRMAMTSVSPKGLRPYIEKWNALGQQEYASEGYHPNDEVLPAYYEYKRDELVALKKQSRFKKVIQTIEEEYEMSWEELIVVWPERYCWGGFEE